MRAIVWSKTSCSFCTKAKALLDEHNISYEERVIGSGWTKDELLQEIPNARTVPQILLDGVYVGGYTDLVSHLTSS
jgi:glutaredoxin